MMFTETTNQIIYFYIHTHLRVIIMYRITKVMLTCAKKWFV